MNNSAMETNENQTALRPTSEQIAAELSRLETKDKRSRGFKLIIATIVVVAAVAVLVAMLWLPVLQVVGRSMSPTLEAGQIVIVTKGRSNVERGDIIAFYYNDKTLIKRVIGIPGDEISIDEAGDVYINGELYDEGYITSKSAGQISVEFPLTVEEGSYFVLGDSRAISMDSRSSEIGTVADSRIIGEVIFRLWPLGEAGTVK